MIKSSNIVMFSSALIAGLCATGCAADEQSEAEAVKVGIEENAAAPDGFISQLGSQNQILFGDGKGAVYVVSTNGYLVKYQENWHGPTAPASNPSLPQWTYPSASLRSNWSATTAAFSGGDFGHTDIIYRIKDNGDLMWDAMDRAPIPPFNLQPQGVLIGTYWNMFRKVFTPRTDGLIYGVKPDGSVWAYGDESRDGGTVAGQRWASWSGCDLTAGNPSLRPIFATARSFVASGDARRSFQVHTADNRLLQFNVVQPSVNNNSACDAYLDAGREIGNDWPGTITDLIAGPTVVHGNMTTRTFLTRDVDLGNLRWYGRDYITGSTYYNESWNAGSMTIIGQGWTNLYWVP